MTVKLASVAPCIPLDGPVPEPLVLLADVWPWIRAGLEQMTHGTDIVVEDVYTVVKNGGAFVFLISVDDSDKGFTILQRQIEIDGSATLLVWFLWCEPGSLVSVQGQVHKKLEEIARGVRCKRLRMYSSRSAKAWERRGWKPKQTVFERGV